MIVTVAGPRLSGKSALVERVLHQRFREVTYIGTLPVSSRFAQRIADHAAKRPRSWRVIEVRGRLVDIDIPSTSAHAVLLDGLAVYLARRLSAGSIPLSVDTWVNLLGKELCMFLEFATKSADMVWIVTNSMPDRVSPPFVSAVVCGLNSHLFELSDKVHVVPGVNLIEHLESEKESSLYGL
jgi:adenosyl cobinamide kinase/adenosyl cobinamide phosphate guanylyltransferase